MAANRIILLLVACCIFELIAAECVSECPTAMEGMVADPYDCTKFYFCSGGIDVEGSPFFCGVDKYFDDTTGSCVPAGESACENTCDRAPSSCPISDCSADESGDCTGLTNTYADLVDCSSYYICSVESVPIQLFCVSPNLYYNGDKCVTDDMECCSKNRCTPFCENGDFSKVANPCDCHSYYVCDRADKIPRFTGECAEGEVFVGSVCVPDPDDELCPPSFCSPSDCP